MSKQLLACVMFVTVATSGLASRTGAPDTHGVAVSNRPADRRVDISIDGQRVALLAYENGPQIAADGSGATPLKLAKTRGYREMIAILEKSGAK